jgi:YD repeat-containing protein
LLGGIRTAISRIPLTSASGRMTAMHTTRSPAEITSAADIFTLSDRTTWSYDQPTGLLTNAVSRTRLTGLGGAYSADGADGILTAEQHSVDARGNVTIARTVIDRGNKTVHQLTYTPGSAVAALATTVNGLLVSSRSASGLVTTYAYDALDLVSETQNGVLITRSTDLPAPQSPATRQAGALGRSSGFSLGPDYAVQYAYDAYSRFHSVASASSAQSAVSYTYSEPRLSLSPLMH